MTRCPAPLLMACALAVAGCAAGGTTPPSTAPTTAPPTTAAAAPTTAAAAPTTAPTTASAAPASTTASTTAPTTSAAQIFRSSVHPIDDALARRMGPSWRVGCPVPLGALRYVRVAHWDDDGVVRDGELVVNESAVDAIVAVFAALFDARFPIHRMQLVDDYGGDDQASMRANNTSAFNCREVNGRPGVLSNHSWGTAIDINPLVNPWVAGSFIDPPEGAPYADRTRDVPGMIHRDSVVVRAFAAVGWGWGGTWPSSKDWQHFSASGS